MSFHDAYVSDTHRLLGNTMPHDDSMNERHPGSRLENAHQKTVFLWENNHILSNLTNVAQLQICDKLFDETWNNQISPLDKVYAFPGGMWRGDIENAGLASVHDLADRYP